MALKYPFAPRSNTIREGPILECVQKQLGPHINAVCLNKKSAESPPMTKHTDGKNAGPSWVCLWGDFEDGGELCLEDGTVYAEKKQMARTNGGWNYAALGAAARLGHAVLGSGF